MKYRSRTEILAMMLKATTEKISQTKIMYKAYLSFSQLKEYMTFLKENEMVSFDNASQLYYITEKGRQFLTVYDQMSDLVTPVSQIKYTW